MFFANFPRVHLGTFPTPLEHMPRYGGLWGHKEMYIKRDDHISLGLGGNKVRHLEFWLGEALEQNADVIIAAGLLQSNLCRLTAAAAAKMGLECILVHNEEEPHRLQGNMLLNHVTGATSIFLGQVDEEARGAQVQDLERRLRAQGRNPYSIGHQALGALGYAVAALELHKQGEERDLNLKHVVIVGAMGATASGLIYGTALLGKPFHIHVISVEYSKEYVTDLMKDVFKSIIGITGREVPVPFDEVMTVYDAYLGEGYAIPTPESLKAIYDLAGTEGIFLETVYTSKTLWGMGDLIARGIIPEDEAAVFFHTGGIPTLFADQEYFPLQS